MGVRTIELLNNTGDALIITTSAYAVSAGTATKLSTNPHLSWTDATSSTNKGKLSLTVGEKTGTIDIGKVNQAFYANNVPNANFGSTLYSAGYLYMGGDGVVETGRYLDFHHNLQNGTNYYYADYNTRLTISNPWFSTGTKVGGNVITLGTGEGTVGLMKLYLNYWGLQAPNGNDSNWIRTTSNGIIPYSNDLTNGKSSLGTDSWPFKEIHVKNIKSCVSVNTAQINTDLIYDSSGTNALLSYAKTNVTGSDANKWTVGPIDKQGVIRSNNSDLLHYRGNASYMILTEANYGWSLTSTQKNKKGWYRIATSKKGIAQNLGKFIITSDTAGLHTCISLTAGQTFGRGTNLTCDGCTYYSSSKCITKARIVYHATYTDHYAYLEVYLSYDTESVLKVEFMGHGWLKVDQAGEIPSEYTSYVIDIPEPNQIKASQFKGNADSVSNSLTISSKGGNDPGTTYNGSAAKTISPKSILAISSVITSGNSDTAYVYWGTSQSSLKFKSEDTEIKSLDFALYNASGIVEIGLVDPTEINFPYYTIGPNSILEYTVGGSKKSECFKFSGLAASNHNHNDTYLKLTGGTVTGDTTFNAEITATTFNGNATTATTATTATNLAAKPSMSFTSATSDSAGGTLTVTAGGKTSNGVTISKVRQAVKADSADSAAKLSNTSAIGSASKPVYFTASGTPAAISYTISKSVPSDAVFTDTKNTAGSTNSTSKLFLVGATSQGGNPQTYSHSSVYATNGTIYATTFSGSNANAFRLAHGNYGVILRNDGDNFYTLFTNSGDSAGSWNDLRPIYFNLASGDATIAGGAIYAKHAGNVGIGLSNPTSKLHVAGDITATTVKGTLDGIIKPYLISNNNENYSWIKFAEIAFDPAYTFNRYASCTLLFNLVELLNSASFLLQVFIRHLLDRSSITLNVAVTPLHLNMPPTIKLCSDINRNVFSVYIKTNPNLYNTYYNITKLYAYSNISSWTFEQQKISYDPEITSGNAVTLFAKIVPLYIMSSANVVPSASNLKIGGTTNRYQTAYFGGISFSTNTIKLGTNATEKTLATWTGTGSFIFNQYVGFQSGAGITSDIRYKKDIEPLPSILPILQKIPTFTYTWSKPEDTPYKTFGVSAQDLEKTPVTSLAVHTGLDGTKTVEYSRLSVLAIQGIKELQEENSNLKKRVTELENQVQQIMLILQKYNSEK